MLFKNIPKNKQTKNLIIKVHLGEQTLMRTPTTVMQHIKNSFPELEKHKNIIILPSNTNFTAYYLFKFIDVGIVYNETLGLEMLLNKLLVIISGNAHYRYKEFTYEINSKEEFFNAFENIDKLKKIINNNYEMALKYARLFFLQSEIPFPLRSDIELGKVWKLKELKSNPYLFLRGKNKYLDYICDSILGNEKYIEDWYYKLQ